MTTQGDLLHLTDGRSVIERISVVLAYLSGGGSELLALPFRNYYDRRIKQLQEVLIEEIRAGEMPENTVIAEDHLVAFVLRIGRASLEGAKRRKLKMMARYFTRNAVLPTYSPDTASEFFDITAALTDTDMRCLAVIKRAVTSNLYEENVEGQKGVINIGGAMPIEDLFSSNQSFFDLP
jgi:hypothetical protein